MIALPMHAGGAWELQLISKPALEDECHEYFHCRIQVMAANAQVRTAQIQARYAAPTCRNESQFPGRQASSPIPVCKRG
jgi:hypothetical protein